MWCVKDANRIDEVEDLHRTWGRRIADALTIRNRSNRWLAEQLEVSPSSVGRWVDGTVEIHDASKFAIARALRMPLSDLFPWPDE